MISSIDFIELFKWMYFLGFFFLGKYFKVFLSLEREVIMYFFWKKILIFFVFIIDKGLFCDNYFFRWS